MNIMNQNQLNLGNDPRKIDPTRIDPDTNDPRKNDPTRIDPQKNDPGKADPTRIPNPTKPMEPNRPAVLG